MVAGVQLGGTSRIILAARVRIVAPHNGRRVFVYGNRRPRAKRRLTLALIVALQPILVGRPLVELGAIVVGCGAHQRLGAPIVRRHVFRVVHRRVVARRVAGRLAPSVAALVDAAQIALAAADQVHDRRTAQLRPVLGQVRIRSVQRVMADVVVGLAQVDGTRVVGAVHAVHVEALAAIDGLVGASRLGRSEAAWRRVRRRRCRRCRRARVVHDGHVDGRRVHRLVLELARQRLRAAIVVVQLRWRSLQAVRAFAEAAQRIRRRLSAIREEREGERRERKKM